MRTTFTRTRERSFRASDGVEAAGSTVADAKPLVAEWNRITKVTAGSGVLLPPARVGNECLIVRADRGTYLNPLRIYPTPGDGVGTGNGVLVMSSSFAGNAVSMVCISEGIWDGISALNPDSIDWHVVEGVGGLGSLRAVAVQRIVDKPPSMAGRGSLSVKDARITIKH